MKKAEENYLERVPRHRESLVFTTGEDGLVTLAVENKGIFNRLFQLILKKPKISYIHLDAMGSFIWQSMDGKSSLLAIGEAVQAHFGDEAEPLYERLAQYVKTLEAYKFITF